MGIILISGEQSRRASIIRKICFVDSRLSAIMNTFQMNSFFVCFPLMILLQQSVAKCPTGAVQGLTSEECYVYRSGQASWYQAEEDCVTMNGHLATVCNGFTNSFLPRQACSSSGTNTYYWIGRSYDVGGDGWSLTDGSNCSYSNWASGKLHPMISACRKKLCL